MNQDWMQRIAKNVTGGGPGVKKGPEQRKTSSRSGGPETPSEDTHTISPVEREKKKL